MEKQPHFDRLIGIIVLLIIMVPGMAFALRAGIPAKAFNISFYGAGARAMSMGGAFISIADDATAVEWNPAGICVMIKPEVFLSAKLIDFTHQELKGGTADAIEYQDVKESYISPTFGSLVIPINRFVLGFYRLVVADWRKEWISAPIYTSDSQAVFISGLENKTITEVVNYGITPSYRLKDNFYIGASLRYSALSNDAEGRRWTPGSTSPTVNREITDNYMGIDLGALYKFDHLRLGMVYKSGGSIEYYDNYWGDEYTLTEKINIPWSLGFGISGIWSNFTAAFDAVYVPYSNLGEDLVLPDDPAIEGVWYPGRDVVELHLGLEYVVVLGRVPIALRSGIFYQPAHLPYYDSKDSTQRDDIFTANVFYKDDDLVFLSAGLGTAIGRVKVDIGYTTADNINETLISIGFRF